MARPSCFRLLTHWARRAASRAAWTAGSSRAISTAIIAITTNSSIRVKARANRERDRSGRYLIKVLLSRTTGKKGWNEATSSRRGGSRAGAGQAGPRGHGPGPDYGLGTPASDPTRSEPFGGVVTALGAAALLS